MAILSTTRTAANTIADHLADHVEIALQHNMIDAAAQAIVATSETSTSTTYTDLATAGPAVTVTIGATGRALVIVSAQLSNVTATGFAGMGYAGSGANTIAAADTKALVVYSSGAGQYVAASAAYVEIGLTAGSTTFTAKYRQGGGTVTAVNRRIFILPF